MKKIKWSILICLIILVLGFLYFRPVSLEKYLTEVKDVAVLNVDFKFENGKPETTHEMYTELSENQSNQIVELLKEYSYRRKIGTIFPDGRIQGAGYTVGVYLYDANYSITSITLTDTEEIVINSHKYKMNNSARLVYDILKIVKESE